MRFGITWKILSAVFITTLLVVTSMLLLIQWSFDRGFLEYVNTLEKEVHKKIISNLVVEYEENKGWQALQDDRRRWHGLLLDSLLDVRKMHDELGQTEERPEIGREHFRRHMHKLGRSRGPGDKPPGSRVALFDADKNKLIGKFLPDTETQYQEIRSNGAVVGYLGSVPAKILSDMHDVRFSRHLTRTFLIIAILMLIVSLLLAWPLSRKLVKPIRQLATTTRELASGNFQTRIEISSKDELGDLSRDFNHLAKSLESNENARQQWIADISHELRTPISVLRGEIEALQDGVRDVTPERLSSLHHEIMNLVRLVDDLYELSMSDIGALNYNKNDIVLHELLTQCLENHHGLFQEKGIRTSLENNDTSESKIFADPDRLSQLFSNIFNNSQRYTDENGEVRISVSADPDSVLVSIEDSAPGVSEDDLPRIFDRLYRVESSRNRTTGGTGLGLAIVKNIIDAHDASISALQSDLGGLKICIRFPRVQ